MACFLPHNKLQKDANTRVCMEPTAAVSVVQTNDWRWNKNDQKQMNIFKMKPYVVPSFLYIGWPDSTSFYDSETAQPESERKNSH